MCKSRRFRPRARTAKVADLRMCKSRHFSVCTCVQSRRFSDPRRKTFVQVVCGLVVTRRTKLFVAQKFSDAPHITLWCLCVRGANVLFRDVHTFCKCAHIPRTCAENTRQGYERTGYVCTPAHTPCTNVHSRNTPCTSAHTLCSSESQGYVRITRYLCTIKINLIKKSLTSCANVSPVHSGVDTFYVPRRTLAKTAQKRALKLYIYALRPLFDRISSIPTKFLFGPLCDFLIPIPLLLFCSYSSSHLINKIKYEW